MRRFNLALNQSKLETKRIQLTQLQEQTKALETKLAEVAERVKAKHEEILVLETQIQANSVTENTASS